MDGEERALRIAQNLIGDIEGIPPTPDQISQAVRDAIAAMAPRGIEKIDEAKLVRELEGRYNVWIRSATVLEESKDHIPWLPEKRAEILWDFWARYERQLLEERGWAPASVREIDRTTDLVLSRFEDPSRPGRWDRRGMVVGDIQSGKTSHYTGLICKAVDAGYGLVIVLAGLHNSLRSQTQLRLDESFLGFDTQGSRAFNQANLRIGVGRYPSKKLLIANSGTSSAEDGDFRRTVAEQFGIVPGGDDPVLLVVKKNASVLKNLIEWALAVRGEFEPDTKIRVVRNVPLLLIDDEADIASVNTKLVLDESGKADPDPDPSKINALIRTLLRAFHQSCYVGYTATPFANIFIYPEQISGQYGDDLFPGNFIVNLRAPSNYIGPARVFGLDRTTEDGDQPTLPLIRDITDESTWLSPSHRPGDIPDHIPPSLRDAMMAFVLGSAVRIWRDCRPLHNTMLVHVTRFLEVQARIADLIDEDLRDIQRRLRFGDGASEPRIWDEFKALWHRDYEPTFAEARRLEPDLCGASAVPSWNEIEPLLAKVANRIQILQVNGSANDALIYRDFPNGLFAIVVGGDKLSRGLTLEGLTVSYFLRASKMYDTLMQMGRWFGYRPGYLDVCRLYISPELHEWYRHITSASEELRLEFDHMASIGGTPRDYGFRVRTHPNGLLITAANKLRTGTELQLSYAGDISETVAIHNDTQLAAANINRTDSFLRSLSERNPPKVSQAGHYVWNDVDGSQVSQFIGTLATHRASRKADSGLLSEYIRTQLGQGELATWTVALISNRGAPRAARIADLEVGLVRRTFEIRDGRLSIGRLVSPRDEQHGLSDTDISRALQFTIEEWERDKGRYRRDDPPKFPSGRFLRHLRGPSRGLVLLYPLDPSQVGWDTPILGFALSFGNSEHPTLINYRVTNVFWDQEFGQ